MNKLQKQKMGEFLRDKAMRPKVKTYFLSSSDKNYENKKKNLKKDLKDYAK